MRRGLLIAILSIVVVPGGRHADGESDDHDRRARAMVKNAAGEQVGEAVLRETPNGVLVRATLRGVPAGTHAFHIHETGRCEVPSFESAGGHFAPFDRQHGFLDPAGPHGGDLPNAHAPAHGALTLELFVDRLTLRTGPASLLDADGAAFVVHAGEDDYRSEPAGDAGRRIACGVITR